MIICLRPGDDGQFDVDGGYVDEPRMTKNESRRRVQEANGLEKETAKEKAQQKQEPLRQMGSQRSAEEGETELWNHERVYSGCFARRRTWLLSTTLPDHRIQ